MSSASRWKSHGPAREVVQIAQGLGEHIRRCAGMTECLVQAELVVYGNDHRGHGRTALSPQHLGDLAPKDLTSSWRI